MVRFAQHQRGFTLIEMSIVLVIIGLIVGGILKGQELIESSRQKNAISQVDRVRAGVTTFVDRYRAYPGDYGQAVANIFAGVGNGDDNGFVGARQVNLAGLIGVDGSAAGENKEFFNHLAASDLLGGVGVLAAASVAPGFSGVAGNSPLPQSAFPSSGLTIAYGVHQGGATPQTASFHWLRMSRFRAAALTSADGIVSPQRAQQLDLKYDDGIPMTGALRTGGVSGTGTATDCGAVGSDAGYAGAVTTVGCILMFQLN